ncbi:MAG: NAD(P)H-dependent oxidoreductase [Comamonas sp.]
MSLATLSQQRPLRLLRIAASPRGAASESRRLSQEIVDAVIAREAQRGVELVELDASDLPAVDAGYALALASREEPPPPAADSALHRSDALIAQLAAADIVVIATPMHNFTLPSALKAWIDHIVRIRVTFNATPQGKIGCLEDRPVYVAVSSGGLITGESARQPDFLQPYLRHTLSTIGLHDLHFVTVEGTALGEAALHAGRGAGTQAVAALLALDRRAQGSPDSIAHAG